MAKERDILINIIQLYKDMPYLWNKNDKNYMNKNIRNEGYEVLLKLYKSVDENATIKTLKKKIDNLKTNYIRESKKVRESIHTGAGNEDIYVPTIWYYDIFSFLESTTESCRSVRDTIGNEGRNLVTDPLDHEEEKNASCSAERITAQNRTTRRRLNPPELQIASQQMSEALNNFNNIINRTTNEELEDECDIFGKLIAKKLKKLPEHEREDLMFEIHALFQRSRLVKSSSIESFRPSTPKTFHS